MKLSKECSTRNNSQSQMEIEMMFCINRKKGCFNSLLFIVFIFLCAMILNIFTGARRVASFNIPERFIYDLRWMGINAGTASLEIVDNDKNLKIISTARSANWISLFYTVEDRIESSLCKNFNFSSIGQPSTYRVKIREGKHRRDKEIIFNHENNKAKYIDYLNNKRKEYDIPTFIFDPLSSFYYIRTLDLNVGESVFVTIFDSKKIWNVEVQVLRKEKIILPVGTFNTIVIKPLLRSEGIFSRKGDIYIWLTDDIKRIPVKLQTEVAVGHVTAILTDGSY